MNRLSNPDPVNEGLLLADTVAKLPERHAINFPEIDQTSRNHRPISPTGRYRGRL
jgi:hypothetical protein